MNEAFERALHHLPHGPEFRFIDQLLELEPGVRGVAEYLLRGDEVFLCGHFPGQPIMPGVLLVEAAAQLAGVVAQSDPSREPLKELKLTAIRSAKILGAVVPGQTNRFEACVVGRMGGLVQAAISAHAGSNLVLQGEVALSGRS